MPRSLVDPLGSQPALFPLASLTVASPLCFLQAKPCPREGRAIFGEPVKHRGCVNQRVECQTCGRTGEVSERTV